jgi:hypothetical protein
MKHGKLLTGFMVLFCASALFLACPTEPEDDPNYGKGEAKTLNISVAATDGTVYYSLSTGEQVTGDAIGTNAWDIAFKRSRLIFTNSGPTPEYKGADDAPYVNSTGSGGVWHVEKTDFADVTDDDAVEDDSLYTPYNKDVVRYVTGMGGSAAASRLNVMTFVGYSNESENDGLSQEKNFSAPYSYDKKQYYVGAGMPPKFDVTNQIYIIKHGDGSTYSKVQVTAYASNTADGASIDEYQIKYQNF